MRIKVLNPITLLDTEGIRHELMPGDYLVSKKVVIGTGLLLSDEELNAGVTNAQIEIATPRGV